MKLGLFSKKNHQTWLSSAAAGKRRSRPPLRAAPPCQHAELRRSIKHLLAGTAQRVSVVTAAVATSQWASSELTYFYILCRLIPPRPNVLWNNSHQKLNKNQTFMNDFLTNWNWFDNRDPLQRTTSVLSAAQRFNVERKHEMNIFLKAINSDFHLGMLIKGLFLWI